MFFVLRPYLWYKLLNSLFFGLTVGSIFVLYTPLEPSVFSLGGIMLAVGLLVVAKLYEKMMNLLVFYYVTLAVELLALVIVVSLLGFKFHYASALFIYASYQVTFMFGSYLVRIETLVLKRTALLSFADVMKQKGYLYGMVISYLFYKALEGYGIVDKQMQVYWLHSLLFVLQIAVLALVFRSFVRR
jgi:putative membrane protein